jgi:hypothetical protein
MKRATMFALLALLAFSALTQVTSTSAQINCQIYADHIFNSGPSPFTRHYRVVNSANPSALLGGPVAVTFPVGQTTTVYISLSVPFTGQVRIDRAANAAFSPFLTLYNNVNVNCQGNNAEINASCDKLGLDVGLHRVVVSFGVPNSTAYTLKIFKNGNPFSTEIITINGVVGPILTMPATEIIERSIDTIPPNASDVYTYQVICGPSNAFGCANAPGATIANGAVVKSGTLERKCDSPCGPSLAGRPLGLMTASVPFHWAPQAGAASTFIAEAGKTFKVLRTSGDFTEVVLACKAYWVPSSAIQIIGN